MIKRLSFLISILLRVAFVTLWERKVLRYAQSRKGPNLVGTLGVLQPFSDGLKLLTKEKSFWGGNSTILSLSPLLFFIINLLAWLSLPLRGLRLRRGLLCLLVFRSLGGLLIFLTGWNGGRRYSFIGGVRASAQIISYEVVISFFFLARLRMFFRFSFRNTKLSFSLREYWLGGFFFLPCWIIILLAETNRAPFDLTEGESELVRGFNTEYSSFPFTLLFLGEYSFIILFSSFTSFLFFGNFLFGGLIVFFVLWIRSCFPRKRYDFLINIIWLEIFPIVLLLIFFQFSIIYFYVYFLKICFFDDFDFFYLYLILSIIRKKYLYLIFSGNKCMRVILFSFIRRKGREIKKFYKIFYYSGNKFFNLNFNVLIWEVFRGNFNSFNYFSKNGINSWSFLSF